MAILIYVLGGTGPNTYRLVVHSPTPTGNNSAGFPWSQVLINAGWAKTSLTEGTGPGQISPAEKIEVEAGRVIERGFEFMVDPTWTNAQRNAALDAEAAKLIDETEAYLANNLKWYGATRQST